jgi:hypothetical protein
MKDTNHNPGECRLVLVCCTLQSLDGHEPSQQARYQAMKDTNHNPGACRQAGVGLLHSLDGHEPSQQASKLARKDAIVHCLAHAGVVHDLCVVIAGSRMLHNLLSVTLFCTCRLP